MSFFYKIKSCKNLEPISKCSKNNKNYNTTIFTYHVHIDEKKWQCAMLAKVWGDRHFPMCVTGISKIFRGQFNNMYPKSSPPYTHSRELS